jgi:PucR C-terminal helix-turn-helix domain
MAISEADRQALVSSIAPRIDTVVERTVQRAKHALSAYADVSADDLRDGIVADLGRALAALMEERELTEADRASMSRIGDARAQEGIPLEAMLQVYRFTIDEIFNGLWEAADEGVVPAEAVLRITRLIWRYADPMMDVAVQAYRRRELQQAVADSQNRTALVLRLLLSAGDLDPASRDIDPGLDPNAEYVAIRARPSRGQRDLLLELGTPGAIEGGAVAPYEGGVIGYARRGPSQCHDPEAIIGVGPPGPLSQLPHSFTVASRIVETATAFGYRGIHTIDALAFEAIARAETTITTQFIDRFIAPCEPDTTAGRELLDTVGALLDHELSVERAAAALFVHPNTVRNRLRRFEQLTSSNLRCVNDLSALRVALLGARLMARSAAAPA